MFHQVPCGLREQHLPSVPSTHDARNAMHVQAHIALSGKLRFARMHTHARADRHPVGRGMARKRALGVDRSCEGIGRTRKGHEEAISLRVHLVPVRLVACGAQEAAALSEDLWVALAQLLEQGGGPLHVAEEQGHGAPGKVMYGGCPSSGFGWVSRGQDRKRLSRCIFTASLFQRQGKGLYTGKAELWVFGQGLKHDLFHRRWEGWHLLG